MGGGGGGIGMVLSPHLDFFATFFCGYLQTQRFICFFWQGAKSRAREHKYTHVLSRQHSRDTSVCFHTILGTARDHRDMSNWTAGLSSMVCKVTKTVPSQSNRNLLVCKLKTKIIQSVGGGKIACAGSCGKKFQDLKKSHPVFWIVGSPHWNPLMSFSDCKHFFLCNLRILYK